MIYATHHAAALLGAALTAAALLHGKAWTRQHPRAAVTLWHLLSLTCLLASFGFLVSVALPALGVVPALGAIGRGKPSMSQLNTVEAVALLSAFAMLTLVLATYAHATFRSRRAQSRQRLLLDLVAHPQQGQMAVIDHTAPLVYAVPGREPTIVATTAAIRALTPPELAAVLAHERNHLSARHDLAILPFAMFRRLFRRAPLSLAVHSEVDLLLEMCADDHAARLGHLDPLRSSLEVFVDEERRAAELRGERLAGQALTARRDRLEPGTAGVRLGVPLLAYVSALTFLATTLSLYVLPL
ncbi:M48 family metalloprotease [Kribbella sp. NPDC026611]|uniref:M56 family metallopeptidase n=1 Tax=Kribbella sp. NPDC026611 TaxID=3154911 RepID=UPI0033ED72E8